MDNKQSLLAICIPTYNRDYILERNLEKLCPVAHRCNVPIYVSDNASPDNTKEVLKKYKGLYPQILFFETQEYNIGPDANFEYVLKMPDSKYRWLMADASHIDEQGMNTVVYELSSNNYNLYITGGDGDRVSKFQSEIFTDPSRLLSTIGWHMTWISCLIYNWQLIQDANFVRYYNSHFIQTGVIFEYFSNHSCNVRFNKDVIVDVIPGEKRDHWLPQVFDIFARDWYLFVMSLPLCYSYECKIKCIKDSGRYASVLNNISLTRFRAKRLWAFKDIWKNRFFVQQTFDFNILILISIVPIFILRMYLFADRVVRGIYRRIPFLE